MGIEVLRPANPLSPPPEVPERVCSEAVDAMLLKLPEWSAGEVTLVDLQAAPPADPTSEPQNFDEQTVESQPPAMGANPVAVRVGVATPNKGPIRRSRVRRMDDDLGTPAEPPQPTPKAPRETKPKPAASERGPAKNAQERVRHLSSTEQQKVARSGELADRIALERVYGKAVWETLLQNPKLTPPEVLRIARMAGLPMPLLELIVGNRAWIASPQIRRALLANRRLTKDMIATILRVTPKNELRIMHKQTAYPAVVREAAAKLLK